MWETRLTQMTDPPGGHDVILSKDDLTYVISLDDWWRMSATQHLADKALKDNDLDFRMSEIYGPPGTDQPLWTTELVPTDNGYDVRLIRGGEAVAHMSLDEWAGLSATEFAMEDSVEVAQGLAAYGRNIDEVNEHIEEEGADEDENEDENEDEDEDDQ